MRPCHDVARGVEVSFQADPACVSGVVWSRWVSNATFQVAITPEIDPTPPPSCRKPGRRPMPQSSCSGRRRRCPAALRGSCAPAATCPGPTSLPCSACPPACLPTAQGLSTRSVGAHEQGDRIGAVARAEHRSRRHEHRQSRTVSTGTRSERTRPADTPWLNWVSLAEIRDLQARTVLVAVSGIDSGTSTPGQHHGTLTGLPSGRKNPTAGPDRARPGGERVKDERAVGGSCDSTAKVEEGADTMTLDAAAESQTGVAVGEVEESVALDNLDMLARRFLSMSGSEFLRRRAEGTLEDLERWPGFTRVLAVATLLD